MGKGRGSGGKEVSEPPLTRESADGEEGRVMNVKKRCLAPPSDSK